MGTNVTIRLDEFWEEFIHDTLNKYRADDNAAMVTLGRWTVDAFRPDALENSDLVKQMHIGLAVLAAFHNSLRDTNHPQLPVVEAVAQSLMGVYGLGERRGRGEAYLTMGDKKEAARYIDPALGDTLPSPRRAEEMKEKIGNIVVHRKE